MEIWLFFQRCYLLMSRIQVWNVKPNLQLHQIVLRLRILMSYMTIGNSCTNNHN